MKFINLKCHKCGSKFNKVLKEVRRHNKKGRFHFYCSKECSSKFTAKYRLENITRVTKHLDPANRRDIYSRFRTHLSRINKRNKVVDISLEDMLEVWSKQKGLCVYSSVKLKEVDRNKCNDPIYTMSIDRIDSSKGYSKNNIQFISIAMNHLKNNMSHTKMLEVLRIIRSNVVP